MCKDRLSQFAVLSSQLLSLYTGSPVSWVKTQPIHHCWILLTFYFLFLSLLHGGYLAPVARTGTDDGFPFPDMQEMAPFARPLDNACCGAPFARLQLFPKRSCPVGTRPCTCLFHQRMTNCRRTLKVSRFYAQLFQLRNFGPICSALRPVGAILL